MLFSDVNSVSDCVFCVIVKCHGPKASPVDALNGHLQETVMRFLIPIGLVELLHIYISFYMLHVKN